MTDEEFDELLTDLRRVRGVVSAIESLRSVATPAYKAGYVDGTRAMHARCLAAASNRAKAIGADSAFAVFQDIEALKPEDI